MTARLRVVPGRLDPGGPVHRALEEVLARCDTAARVASDPVEFVHRYADPRDAEVVALIASSMAFGNVTALRAKIDEVLRRVGPKPSRASTQTALRAALRGFRHRLYGEEELSRLVVGACELQSWYGSLGACFARGLSDAKGDLRIGLGRFVHEVRGAGGLESCPSRGARHLLPDPEAASGCKRLLLFLRWMVRGPDGVDLGLFRNQGIAPDVLLVPLDVHIHRLSRNLGLTARNDASWRTATEVTASLARFDPSDPVRFDFALCHFGMLRGCPSRSEPVACSGCPVREVCVHHAPSRNGRSAGREAPTRTARVRSTARIGRA